MLRAARYFRPGAWARSSATSSGLSTTGSRSGAAIRAKRSPNPGRPKSHGRRIAGPYWRGSSWQGLRRARPCGADSGGLIAAQVFRLSLIGGSSEQGGERANLSDVGALGVLAELADGHAFDHSPAQRRDGFRAHGRLPSEVRLEPHDLRTGRAAAYITAECLPLLPRERFSPLSAAGRGERRSALIRHRVST